MSKEIEALEEIQNYKIKFDVNIKYENADETEYRFETIRDMFPKQFDIIETALKKLDKPKEIVATTTVDKALEQVLIDSCPEVAKKLKALDIIREKPQTLFLIKTGENYDDYLASALYIPYLADIYLKEEYDLLKEVFLWK